MTELTLERLAQMIGAELHGSSEATVTGVNALQLAEQGELTYAEESRYLDQVRASAATAFVVPEDFPSLEGVNLLRVVKPKIAFIQVTEWFYPKPDLEGVDSTASIHELAEVAPDVTVGACAVISAGATIGSGCVIQPGAYIGPAVTLGRDCRIEANAALLEGVQLGNRVIVQAGATLGGDGYGFVWIDDHHHRIPQVGQVLVEDDVEIGCNSCVDRATFGATRIGRGTKIDNQVHIAHNCDIGEDVIITAQVAIAGSATVGNGVMFGGQAGVTDHATIGAGARIGGATPVINDVGAGEMVWGFPGKPMAKAKRELAGLSRLPDLLKRVRQQESELSELRDQVAQLLASQQSQN